MHYTTSLPFRGNADRAFGLAETALTAIGFRLTDRTSDSRELIGPGMNSSRQNALRGATRIRVFEGGGELAVEGDLGGVAWLSKFVTVLPIGIVLVVGLVLSVVFGVMFGEGLWIATVAAVMGANFVMWLVLGPLIARGLRRKTDYALDTLLANMVAVGEGGC